MFLAGIQTCPHENGEMEPQMEVGAHWKNQSWLKWSPTQIGDWIPAKNMREWQAFYFYGYLFIAFTIEGTLKSRYRRQPNLTRQTQRTQRTQQT